MSATESEARPPGDDDLAPATPPLVVRAASGVVMVAGLSAVLVGLQNLLGFELYGIYFVLPFALLIAGLGEIAIGWIHGAGRLWAAFASLATSAIVALVSGVWLVVSVLSCALSLMALLSLGISLLAVVACPFSLGPCRRTTLARQRLRAAGLDLGT